MSKDAEEAARYLREGDHPERGWEKEYHPSLSAFEQLIAELNANYYHGLDPKVFKDIKLTPEQEIELSAGEGATDPSDRRNYAYATTPQAQPAPLPWPAKLFFLVLVGALILGCGAVYILVTP